MITDFTEYFTSFDFIKDVFLIFLGALLSYIYTKGSTVWKVSRSKKILEQSRNSDKILTIDSAFPAYSNEDIITELSDEAFYLEIPSEELNTLQGIDPHYISRENHFFTKQGTLSELGASMGIADFEALVQKHKRIVAQDFVDRIMQGQEIFNNEKLGIRKIIRSRTNSTDENSILRIRFFKTDYFTHRVMRSVYADIRQQKLQIASVNELYDINRYFPFLTSLGVNSLLLIESEEFGRAIVLSNRTKTSANMSDEQWHVSMNEGINFAELVGDNINLEHCVRRGYEEEPGIRSTIKNVFTDLFLVRKTFEIGIASTATTNMSEEDFRKCYAAARDRSLESIDVRLIPDRTKDIKKFLNTHNAVTDIAEYCLSMYIGRSL